MCTYEDLVAATLPYGLSPLVVPQLKTITLGGAVTGLGIESASFRNGLPHESVLEMDILTGAGEIVTASPRAALRSVPRVPEFLWHAWLFGPAADRAGARQTVRRAAAPAIPLAERSGRGDGPHHRDRWHRRRRRSTTSTAWCSAPTRATCASACRPTTPGPVSDYTGQRHLLPVDPARRRREARPADHPRLPVALGHRLVLVLAGVRRAEPDDPPVLAAALPAQQLLLEAGRLRPALRHRRPDRETRNGRPPRERVVQDIEVPIERRAEFLEWFLANVPIEPIWLCPLRLRDDPDADWPLYPIRPRPHLRQRRLLVVGAGRARTTATRIELIEEQGQRARRSQIAVLRRLLLAARSSTNSTAGKPTRP